MRDDLHKGAPVSRPYRSFMKTCAEEDAGRPERAALRAAEAVVSDLAEVSVGFVARLTAELAQRQLALLPRSAADLVAVQAGSILERRVVEHLPRVIATGKTGEAAVSQALHDALRERVDSRVRAIEGHVAAKMPKAIASRREFMARVRGAIEPVKIDQHCRTLLRGERPAAPPRPPKKNFDPDQGL